MSAPTSIDHVAAMDELAEALAALLARRWRDRQARPPDERSAANAAASGKGPR